MTLLDAFRLLARGPVPNCGTRPPLATIEHCGVTLDASALVLLAMARLTGQLPLVRSYAELCDVIQHFAQHLAKTPDNQYGVYTYEDTKEEMERVEKELGEKLEVWKWLEPV